MMNNTRLYFAEDGSLEIPREVLEEAYGPLADAELHVYDLVESLVVFADGTASDDDCRTRREPVCTLSPGDRTIPPEPLAKIFARSGERGTWVRHGHGCTIIGFRTCGTFERGPFSC